MAARALLKRWPAKFAVGLPHAAIVLLTALLYLQGYLDVIDDKLAEQGFWLSARPATGEVILVEIDAASIESLQTWPWPRRLHAQLLDRLMDAGAARVAFDVDFSARSNTIDDAALEAALRRASGKVVLPAFRQYSRAADGSRTVILSKPLPQFGQHAALASVNVKPENDGLVRTMAVAEGGLPSLASLLADSTGVGGGDFRIDFGIDVSSIPRLRFVDILHGNFDRAAIAGKQVVVGSTAIELGDQVAVPVYRTIPGPLAHILGYESLAQNRALYKIATGPVIFGLVIVAFLAAFLFAKWSWRKSVILLILLAGGLISLSLATQAALPLLVDISPMLVAVVLSFVIAMVRHVDQQALRLVFQSIDLRRKDVMMRNVVEHSFDGIITTDTTGRIESANPSAEAIFGGEIVGSPVQNLFPDLIGTMDEAGLVSKLRVGRPPHEMEGALLTGRRIPVELSVSAVETDNSRLFTIFLRDITDRKQQQQRLEFQATHDALTGLPNRKLFYERLQEAIEENREQSQNFAILLLDLDRFKEVNDTLGHPTGDQLLMEISKRLLETNRDSDTIARIGGDEFALLLPQTDNLEQAASDAQQILDTLCAPYQLAGLSFEIGGSIGIAMYPQHGDETATLVKSADVAMYVAKNSQSGYAVYDEEQDHNSVRFLTLTGDLRRAIQDNQLRLYYQPKIGLKQNHIVAVEALIRWIHPEHGFIPPDEFIEKAEQTGVIGEITEWVLHTALAQAAEWRRKGLNIDMAVNLSARLLNNDDIVKTVRAGLQKWQVRPESFILEVTESGLMADPAKAMEIVTSLSGLGVRISIDDFGTGYSSLEYLKDLPADEMKIDKSFVQTLLEEKSNEAIVGSTVALAHALGLKVVAEGIETDEICVHLQGIACDVGQGYLFSKPLPIDEFDKWLVNSPWGLNAIETADTGSRRPALTA